VGPVVRPVGAVQLPSADGPSVPEDGRAAEKERFGAAAEAVAQRLAERAAAATGVSAEVLATTAQLARDRGLLTAVEQRIGDGAAAPQATVAAAAQFVDLFTSLGGVMAERATDVRDVRDRIVAELTGQGEPGVPTPATPSVLLADDLAPADTAGLDPSLIVALATRLGGATSHTAIIARQLGLPCVVAVGGLNDVPEGVTVLVDGEQGTVTVDPDLQEAQARVAASQEAAAALARYRGPGTTRDGHAVQVLANVQDGAGARAAAAAHAEGVGLLRTELAFFGRTEEPPVEEQAQIYADVFAAFPGGLTPGVMVEVPSVAVLADRFLEHLDFLSIGTNDLSQYTLAADRLSGDLADLTDPWQPALLALVAQTAAAGQRVGKPVGVCGEAAADPMLACVLVGMGITSLSCAASSIAGVGARLATVDLESCRRAADAALAAEDPQSARAAVREVLASA
jgi:phosphoenolpyruvate-protein kinase (PTS system EI component)